MKLLHTSDWHLGKRLLGKDMIPTQREIVDEIAEIAADKRVDLVVVAGDIFDSCNPSPEAVGVLLEGIEKITAGGERALVLVLGESDSPAMLDSLKNLSKRINLAVYTDVGTLVDIDTEANYRVKPVETGRGFIVYENDREERFVVAGLPVSTLTLRGDETMESAIAKGMDTVTRKFFDDSVNILVSHLSVRLDTEVAGEEDNALTTSVFPDTCTYVALGGNHRSEVASMDRNVYYSGSIMPYSFDDSKGDKGVIVATINADKEVRKEVTKLKSSKRLKKVRCASLQDAMNQLDRFYDSFVDLNLSLPQPLSAADSKMLKEKYGNLLQISLTVSGYKGEKKQVDRLSLAPRELFKAFYNSKNNNPMPADLADLYMELTEERGE